MPGIDFSKLRADISIQQVLHLLGFDHDGEASSAKMWAAQAEILKALGSSILAPSQVSD